MLALNVLFSTAELKQQGDRLLFEDGGAGTGFSEYAAARW
jgi:hypothetical protein